MDIYAINKWFILFGVLALFTLFGACGYCLYWANQNVYFLGGGSYGWESEHEYTPGVSLPIAPTWPPPPTSTPSPLNEHRDVSEFTFFQPKGDGAMFEYELPDAEEVLEQGLYGAGASPAHIAVIGTPVASSLRCEWHGVAMTNAQREEALRLLLGLDSDDPLPPTTEAQNSLDSFASQMAPEYRDAMRTNFTHLVSGGVLEGSRILACYVDYTVSEYLLGAGPATLTVAYDQLGKTRSYDLYRKAHAAGRYGDDMLLTAELYAAVDTATVTAAQASINDAVMGRRSVVFVAPMGAHSSIAVEAWQAIAQWDVQTVNGVETAVRYGAGPNDAEYAQPLADFKARVKKAAASDAHAGKRIANASGLNQYYRDIGAYGDITPDDGSGATFAPSQPPSTIDCANGVSVPSPQSNAGLAGDCRTLAALRDTLDRGGKTQLGRRQGRRQLGRGDGERRTSDPAGPVGQGSDGHRPCSIGRPDGVAVPGPGGQLADGGPAVGAGPAVQPAPAVPERQPTDRGHPGRVRRAEAARQRLRGAV